MAVAAAAGAAAGVAAVAEAAALGVGIGWRPELDLTIERSLDVDFVEVIADYLDAKDLPTSLTVLRSRGVPVVPHSIGLSLGSAEQPDRRRLRRLGALAEVLDAPVVSDHLCFTRAGGFEAGHLLPLPLTRDALDVVVENIRIAQDQLPVPLAVENIAALIDWPESVIPEHAFLAEVLERTDALLLLDVENLYANWRNFGRDPLEVLKCLPHERVAYVHVAGGVMDRGLWRDTHAHPVPDEVWDLLAEVGDVPGAMLERDAAYPSNQALRDELDRIRATIGVTHA